MSKTLEDIALELKDNNKKVQLVYAFNGTGKTLLSKIFKSLISPKQVENDDEQVLTRHKILYYNAFTEDLFYWDNDLSEDAEPKAKLRIQPNSFTDWIFNEQAQDQNVVTHFQRYTNSKLSPMFNAEEKDNDTGEIIKKAFSEVTFSFSRGNDEIENNIKISKGEESNFIWCIFYALFNQVIEELNILEEENRSKQDFNYLEYIFIDDPVSSLDENHLIMLAVDLAKLIKSSESSALKFIITTHNPLFYNVLFNEFRRGKCIKYRLEKLENNTYELIEQLDDSPFAYQIHLKNKIEEIFKIEKDINELVSLCGEENESYIENICCNGMSEKDLVLECKKLTNFSRLESFFVHKMEIHNNGKKYVLKFYDDKSISECEVEKYHFNWIRNILEKLSTFLGYNEFKDVLPQGDNGEADAYMNRIVNLSSHSKHSAEESIFVSDNDKRVLKGLINYLNDNFKFKTKFIKFNDFIS